MKCKECQTEMFIDSSEELEDSEVFHYKYPNPKCNNYGYQTETSE